MSVIVLPPSPSTLSELSPLEPIKAEIAVEDVPFVNELGLCEVGSAIALIFFSSCQRGIEFIDPHDAMTQRDIIDTCFSRLVAHKLTCDDCVLIKKK
jgi:hypothetical protein